jgi:hypothetical protein
MRSIVALCLVGLIAAVAAQPLAPACRTDSFYGCAAATYNWEEIAGLAGTTNFTARDDGTQSFLLPFSFSLYGASFNTWWASNNGFVSNDSSDSLSPVHFPNIASGVFEVIAACWSDLDINSNGATSFFGWNVMGTAPSRYAIVEWKDYSSNAENDIELDHFSFQIKMFETSNRVEIHYKTVTASANGEEYAAGMQNADGTVGFNYFYILHNSTFNDANFNGTAVAFTPGGSATGGASSGASTGSNTDSGAVIGVVASFALTVFAVIALLF